MKKIIYVTDTDILNEQLDSVQNRCTRRILTADKCNHVLNNDLKTRNYVGYPFCSIPKTRLKGTKAIVHASMERMPQAYKHKASETNATFEFDGKGWRFIECRRDYIRHSSKAFLNVELELSDSAKNYILDSFAVL